MKTPCDRPRQPSPSAAILLAMPPLILAMAVDAWAAGRWVSGAALERQLAQPVGISWSGTPLRQALYSLGHAQHVAVMLDRRADPDRQLNLSLSQMPLQHVFQQIAAGQGLGVSQLGPVVYFGPPRVTSRLRTLAELRREELRSLPAAARGKFLQPGEMQWSDLAVPRDLLAHLAAQNGITIWGLDQVPHDLWAAADLPPLALVDRLTLIAVQFDLTFQVSAPGKTVRLVPVPDDVAIVRSYPGGPRPEQAARSWAALAPDAKIKVDGNKIIVRGLLEDHQRISGTSRAPGDLAPKAAEKSAGEKRFTVTQSRGQLGQLLEQLASRLQVELRIDREGLQRAGISLQQQAAFSVTDATLDELFSALLTPAGCSFRREGNVIYVGPAR